jgi:6-phosphogluconolactonase
MSRSSRILGLLLCPVFLIVLSVSSHAQTNHFVYTNNNAAGPNSVSGWSVGPGGALTPLAGNPVSTGGDGTGTGFFASVGVHTLLVGNFLYATNDGDNVNGDTTVAGFAIDPMTGALTAVAGSPFESGGSSTSFGTSLAATPDGKFLLLSNPGDATISVFSIDAMGVLTMVSGSPFSVNAGILGVKISPDGKYLYGAETFANSVGVFAINPMTGALGEIPGSPFALTVSPNGFLQPTAVDVTCAGDLLFVADAASISTTTVSVLTVDPMTGALTEIAGSPFQIGTGGNSNTLALSADDKYLYVGNQQTNTVTALAVGVGGALSAVPGSPFANAAGTVAPETMAVDQEGRFLYVANQTALPPTPAAGSVTVYTINPTTGALTVHPGSPTSTGVASFLPSVTAFPSKTCAPACGFDDTFDGTAGTTPAGWAAVSGTPWELDGLGSFVNPSGTPGLNSTAANDEVVTSGDEVYTVNLTRTGAPSGSPYGIILRGDATAAANGRWTNGYAFVITRTSKWFVYKWTPTSVTTLASGTAPTKIINNDSPANLQATNTLRVVANGSTFTFFANNFVSPLVTVNDAMFASGQVGVYIRREGAGSATNQLKVNSATLTCESDSASKAEARATASAPVTLVEMADRPTTRLVPRRR